MCQPTPPVRSGADRAPEAAPVLEPVCCTPCFLNGLLAITVTERFVLPIETERVLDRVGEVRISSRAGSTNGKFCRSGGVFESADFRVSGGQGMKDFRILLLDQ